MSRVKNSGVFLLGKTEIKKAKSFCFWRFLGRSAFWVLFLHPNLVGLRRVVLRSKWRSCFYTLHPKLYVNKMTYIEIKTIAGRQYRYLRESKLLPDGRIVHPNLKYIGPVDPIYEERKKK
jgi:hypothetical protein